MGARAPVCQCERDWDIRVGVWMCALPNICRGRREEDAYNQVPEELKHCQQVNTFHDSLALDDFFFNQITNTCKSCPMCLFMVLLRLLFSWFALCPWVGFSDISFHSCYENVCHMPINQSVGSPKEPFILFILCSFTEALSSSLDIQAL